MFSPALYFAAAALATMTALAPLTARAQQVRAARPTAGAIPVIPLDWRVRTLEGEDVSVSRYRGRPIFLNAWASWCAPCRVELGAIAALRDSLAARGADDVVFLLVALDTRKRAASFARTVPWTLPFFVERDPLPPVLRMRGIPTTWLIDREGRLVHTQHGAVPWASQAAVQFVADALPSGLPTHTR